MPIISNINYIIMNKSYFPQRIADLVLWYTNFKSKLPNYAAELNLTQAEIDNEVAYCEDMINAINMVTTQKGLLKSAVENRISVLNDNNSKLKEDIARHKTAKFYTQAIGEDLGIVGSPITFNPDTYKPTVSAALFGGAIRIRFTKKGVNGINLYVRHKGTSNWKAITRLTTSPFEYQPTLAVEGQPEHYEFRAFGVIKDQEIGVASDITEIIFGE
jgi:hypothetical protein